MRAVAQSASQPRLVERVYASLLEAVASGALPPGTRLTQEWLAGRLNVSRQPVGQALALLKSQGFVCDVGRRGLMVAPLDVDFVESIYAVRGALDRLAARCAAGNVSSDARSAGDKIMAQGRAALASGSTSELIAADIAFHGFVYELSGNPIIGETMGVLWNRLRRVMSNYLRHAEWARDTWKEHEEVLNAVLTGDAEGAERLSGAHVDKAICLLKEELADDKPMGGRGIDRLAGSDASHADTAGVLSVVRSRANRP